MADLSLSQSELTRFVPKYVHIREALRKRIANMQPGDALPPIAELRRSHGVSQPTVDRAIQELRAEGLLESRRGSGVYVTERAAVRRVGLWFSYDLVDPANGEYPRLLLQGFGAAAPPRQVMLRWYMHQPGLSWHERFSALHADVEQRLLDGVVVVALHGPEVRELSVPVVGIGPLPHVSDTVLYDKPELIRLAVAELAGRGRQRIAFILSEPFARKAAHRKAQAEALASCGARTRPEWVRKHTSHFVRPVTEAGRTHLRALWESTPEKPDALVCTDDYAAVGALQAMRELGLDPTRDVLIATHANTGGSALADAPVIAVEFDPAEAAERSLAVLDELIAGRQPARSEYIVAPHVRKTHGLKEENR